MGGEGGRGGREEGREREGGGRGREGGREREGGGREGEGRRREREGGREGGRRERGEEGGTPFTELLFSSLDSSTPKMLAKTSTTTRQDGPKRSLNLSDYKKRRGLI